MSLETVLFNQWATDALATARSFWVDGEEWETYYVSCNFIATFKKIRPARSIKVLIFLLEMT